MYMLTFEIANTKKKTCGGAGGQGLPKFGGFGGDGGKVIVIAKKKIKTLKQVLQKYPKQTCKASTGQNSDKFHLLGENGADLIVQVPVGVLVHKPDGSKEDLNYENELCVIANGGIGGNHTTNFLGVKGEEKLIGLELKLLADVGLVGFPNAGKSTFLKAISKAKPKIAAYPFTTISPQLGVMEYEDGRMISVADLPGLIEGAHQNYGMGIKFLRHAERTKLLLYVLDINPFQLSHKYPERSPFETLLLLNKELDEYGHGMLEKPSILALNKIDTDHSGRSVETLTDLIKNLPASLDQVSEDLHPTHLVNFDDILTMSAMNNRGLAQIKDRIREVMDVHAEMRHSEEMEKAKALSKYENVHKEQTKQQLV
ncbi:GTP-binding protein 10 homolog [Plakobranchus ocellatus]|uniref:GTP-binding protein 10 homolog n=1 Tax=Plakobranchus ocellatus TaxID=259542 RepID=A0AAV4BM90_9GAST|nr:GTP-binding protein 10 homolog [Plakobranchus ocellatus]